jgi:lipoate-protein ligase A
MSPELQAQKSGLELVPRPQKDRRFMAVLFEQIIEVHDPEPHAAALNMALDEALLQHATTPTLRVYGWRARALSLGYFSRFAEAQRTAAGRETVRRWTGGGLVEHGDDLTYTLIVPRTAGFFQHAPLDSYRLIHERIAQWLRARGMDATVAPGSAEDSSSACFASHVRYDVVAGTTKIAGAAQRRTRWGLLHQGSIQLPLADAQGLAEAFAAVVQRTSITPERIQAARQIAEQKYATEDWLRKF